MIRITHLVALLLAFTVSGCAINNYQYQTTGQVRTTVDEQHNAFIYWRTDEDRLWYGRKYEQLELTPSMKVCNHQVYRFHVSEEFMQLDSGPNDIRVATINDQGELERLREPERLRDGSPCGVVVLDGQVVGTEALEEGVRPSLAIFCENSERPERYPVPGIYSFSPVSREKTPEGRERPSCEELFD